MKKILDNLMRVLSEKGIDVNDYYSIAISGNCVTCQGKYKSDIVKFLKCEKGFSFSINEHGHAVAEEAIEFFDLEDTSILVRLSLRITLT